VSDVTTEPVTRTRKQRLAVRARTERSRRVASRAHAELEDWIDAVDELLDQLRGIERSNPLAHQSSPN